tara:strand:+ start:1270 stop:2310 length:1041 start_codon:yes stop_codon:yes gene_type:complete
LWNIDGVYTIFFYWFFPFAIIISSFSCVIFSTNFFIIPFIWVLIIVPIIDYFIPKLSIPKSKLTNSYSHSAALLAVVPAIFLLLILSLLKIKYLNIDSVDAFCIGLGTGITGGAVGISTAHEFIHRKSKFLRGLGIFLLSVCFYSHFRIEHIYGHHMHVATLNDPATARKGENFYAFLIRCVFLSIVSAWSIEKKILLSKNISIYNYRNRMIQYLLIYLLIVITCFAFTGLKGIIFIFTYALISIILLEVVEYIQHYGLKRENINNELEKYSPSHSWNSRHSIADWSTFNLGLHSEHHLIANKEYPLLSHDEKPKEMPANYPTMILMALIPPIWFMVMDKKLNLRN